MLSRDFTLTHASGAALLVADLIQFLRPVHEHQLTRTLAYEALQSPITLPMPALHTALDYAIVDGNLAALAAIFREETDHESGNSFYVAAQRRIAEHLSSTDRESMTPSTLQRVEAAEYYLSRESYVGAPFEHLTPGDPNYRQLLRRRLEGTALAEYLGADLTLIASDLLL